MLEGDYYDGSTLNLRLSQLTKGEYILYYKYEWTKSHPVRKTLINLHVPHEVELQRVDEKQFDCELLEDLFYQFLERRLAKGIHYVVPYKTASSGAMQ